MEFNQQFPNYQLLECIPRFLVSFNIMNADDQRITLLACAFAGILVGNFLTAIGLRRKHAMTRILSNVTYVSFRKSLENLLQLN